MIGPATPGDLWTLRRKPRSHVVLYNEAMLAQPHRVFWCAMRCIVEGSSFNAATLICRERGARAMAQSIGRSGRPEHDLVALTAYGSGHGTPTDPDMWFRLVERLTVLAGQAHVQRLYAALSQHHDELREVFRQIGFTHYTTQTVLRLEGPDWDQGTTVAPLRPQTKRTLFAIQKLYGVVTPRPVQQAEVRDSRTWKLPRARLVRAKARAWVLGSDDNLTTYLHLTSGSAGHVLTIMLHPDVREMTTDVLRFGLGQISNDLPVYLLLRDYQRELMLPASDLGFQPIGEQALFVKHTTATARRPSLVPVLEPLLEPRTSIPTISSFHEDARAYVRTTRHHEQHRPAAGDTATDNSGGA